MCTPTLLRSSPGQSLTESCTPRPRTPATHLPVFMLSVPLFLAYSRLNRRFNPKRRHKQMGQSPSSELPTPDIQAADPPIPDVQFVDLPSLDLRILDPPARLLCRSYHVSFEVGHVTSRVRSSKGARESERSGIWDLGFGDGHFVQYYFFLFLVRVP